MCARLLATFSYKDLLMCVQIALHWKRRVLVLLLLLAAQGKP